MHVLSDYQVAALPKANHAVLPRGRLGGEERRLLSDILEAIGMLDIPLSSLQRRLGGRRELDNFEQQIKEIRARQEAAADAEEYEKAAALRDSEKEIAARRALSEAEWAAAHPDVSPAAADALQRLGVEIELVRSLLRAQSVGPESDSTRP
jgi:ATP-dependent Clp protease ATP-binding subunit ClpA